MEGFVAFIMFMITALTMVFTINTYVAFFSEWGKESLCEREFNVYNCVKVYLPEAPAEEVSEDAGGKD